MIELLAQQPRIGYGPAGPIATEPTALAALALLAANRPAAAEPALKWLAQQQADDGSLGSVAGHDAPRWPTSLAVLAWIAADAHADARTPRWSQHWQPAVEWILQTRGKVLQHAPYLGHDTMLVGWPWNDGTHSWVEPTGLHVLALKAAGRSQHPRAREAVRLLIDRQLTEGGCNCGNTVVLGQELRPHVQPTGIALLALAGESESRQRLDTSLTYLSRAISARTTSSSLGWAVLGLTAHGRRPASAAAWLQAAADRTQRGDRSPAKLALLLLAQHAEASLLVQPLHSV